MSTPSEAAMKRATETAISEAETIIEAYCNKGRKRWMFDALSERVISPLLAAHAAEVERLRARELKCSHCGKPATCLGRYESHIGAACDDCCGHGNEDGFCEPIEHAAKFFERLIKRDEAVAGDVIHLQSKFAAAEAEIERLKRALSDIAMATREPTSESHGNMTVRLIARAQRALKGDNATVEQPAEQPKWPRFFRLPETHFGWRPEDEHGGIDYVMMNSYTRGVEVFRDGSLNANCKWQRSWSPCNGATPEYEWHEIPDPRDPETLGRKVINSLRRIDGVWRSTSSHTEGAKRYAEECARLGRFLIDTIKAHSLPAASRESEAG